MWASAAGCITDACGERLLETTATFRVGEDEIDAASAIEQRRRPHTDAPRQRLTKTEDLSAGRSDPPSDRWSRSPGMSTFCSLFSTPGADLLWRRFSGFDCDTAATPTAVTRLG